MSDETINTDPTTARPLSYYGGKQRIAGQIAKLIPPHMCYVEPFCGGAAIFFTKYTPRTTNRNHYKEVLNDHDRRLINFYRQIQQNPDELIHRLTYTLFSEAEHQDANALVRSGDLSDPVIAAHAYFVSLCQSFSNKLCSGWKRSTAVTTNHSVTWQSKINNLWPMHERLKQCYIVCDDALTIIKQWDSPQTFFYCDPPYPGSNQCHYSGYSLSDFQALVDALNACRGSFILSNYDQPDARIPDDWERLEFDAYSSAAKTSNAETGARTEVIWRRERLVEPDAETLAVMRKYWSVETKQQKLFK